MEPMLASPAQTVPEGNPNIVMEPKYDGWRALLDLRRRGSYAALSTRTGKAITAVPYIISAFDKLLPNSMLDGEIVDLVSDPGSQWNRTQSVLSSRAVHAPTMEDPPLTYVLFDILELNGQTLIYRPLSERRQLLEALISLMPENVPGLGAFSPVVQLSPQFPPTDQGFESLVSAGWEGVVCKDLTSQYVPRGRNGTWLKVKPEQELDALCTGMFEPEVGSKYEGRAVGGFHFQFVSDEFGTPIKGKCGTGMDDAMREDMFTNRSDYVGKVVVVKHAGISSKGALRFPSLIRFRDEADKSSVDVSATIDTGGTKIDLLNRALEAEEERDDYKEKYEEAHARLKGAVKKAATRGTRGSNGKRNYAAMGALKLEQAVRELRAGEGEACVWVTSRNGSIGTELGRAEGVLAERKAP